MAEHFNIAVIGSGPGGYVAALKAGQMGASVACVEYHPFFGGTCLNWGCIPSKALLASASLIHEMKRGGEIGVEAGGVSFNWDKIQARKDKIISANRSGIKGLFQARNVKPFHGRAVLNGPNKIAVRREGAETQEFTADSIILAVGSTPARLPGWPTDPEYVCTSDEALHWKTLPKRLLIVGGGIIGSEFACMMREYDVQVTVVEMMPKFLSGLDGHLAEALVKVFEKRGIRCLTDTKVEDLQLADGGVKARLGNGNMIDADRVLVATGRRPATKDIGLEKAGVELERGFVKVNERMQTTANGIYCIGDANGLTMLAHAASAHGVCAVENALGHEKAFHAPIPAAVYTFPEVASVGLTQEQCEAQHLPVSIGAFPYTHLAKAMTVNATDGFVKVIRHRESDELLGVHMMGHNVTECIHAASALLHQKIKLKDMIEVVMAHPTMSEALHEAAEDSLKMALHLAPRKVLRVQV